MAGRDSEGIGPPFEGAHTGDPQTVSSSIVLARQATRSMPLSRLALQSARSSTWAPGSKRKPRGPAAEPAPAAAASSQRDRRSDHGASAEADAPGELADRMVLSTCSSSASTTLTSFEGPLAA